MKFWTSDLHFSHKRICEFTKRPCAQEDHDAWVTDLWNSQVKKGDEVFHLGDFDFNHNYELLVKRVKSLNGQKKFIFGNHDNEDAFRQLRTDGLITHLNHVLRHRIGKQGIEMGHYPWASWRNQAHGSWHLHGHSHGNHAGEGLLLDVGLDSAYNILGEHRFFTEQDIIDYMEHRKLWIAEPHRQLKE